MWRSELPEFRMNAPRAPPQLESFMPSVLGEQPTPRGHGISIRRAIELESPGQIRSANKHAAIVRHAASLGSEEARAAAGPSQTREADRRWPARVRRENSLPRGKWQSDRRQQIGRASWRGRG